MTAWSARPQIEFTGIRRHGGVRGAVLVLEGSTREDLRRASALAAFFTDRCLLVAVDGGWNTCRAAGRPPDLYVGDADSTRRVPRSVPSVVYAEDKDFSDLAGALREMRRRRVQVLVVAGLLGGRLDHEWANVQELGAHASGFAGVIAPSRRGVVIVTARGFRARTVRGRSLSLFPVGAAAVVSLVGPRWALTRRRLKPGSVGLSNVTGQLIRLTVHRGVAVVVFPSGR
ncbi:MAG TPA: thiamine diphosphokinase [Candidatus Polarisedimenticolaceae bacterium]